MLACTLVDPALGPQPAFAAAPAAGLRLVAEGYTSPIALVPFEDASGRVLIVDQIGVVKLLSPQGPAKVFMDLRSKLIKLNSGFDERGVLGLALHPRFKENRKLYVYYSAPLRSGGPQGWDHTSHISEFQVLAANPDQVDLASERLLLQIDQPQSNHNCGRMVFGPDGFLYIATGDGGAAHDVGLGHASEGNGQNLNTLLGKILRIDIDKGQPYGIPADNLFAKGGGRPEIYALGLRNPWGISFDRGGQRQLFAADVGQSSWEEINIIVNGGNYGWRIREGFVCFDPNRPTDPPADCPKIGARGEPLLDPILAYKNLGKYRRDPEAKGISVTGGYVYRGKALPHLQGKYVFADWSKDFTRPSGIIYVASPPKDPQTRQWTLEALELATHPGGDLKSFAVALGENAEGELYVMTNDSNGLVGTTGKVYKIVPSDK
ncbi:MAG: PQQ-dependent sugar dehydrogenase [Verrucomicrobiota bacterium]